MKVLPDEAHILAGASRAFPYLARAPVGGSRGQPCGLAAPVGGSRTLPFTVVAQVGGSRAFPYGVVAQVAASGAFPYEKARWPPRTRSSPRSARAGHSPPRCGRSRGRAELECEWVECHAGPVIDLAAYAEARSSPFRFFVLPGHEDPEVEKVVLRKPGHLVVEKVREAAREILEDDSSGRRAE